jgi:hypothetical protein
LFWHIHPASCTIYFYNAKIKKGAKLKLSCSWF